jgi:pimeloyl-ACP methyl ester carboxylesterase
MRRVLSAVAAGILAAGFVPATLSTAAPAPTSITWGPCPADVVGGPNASALRCGSVSVPLDYRRPDGPHIDIAVSKLPAKSPAHRRGSLVLNPGGPGSAGLGTPPVVAATAPAATADAYDLIGFDPRGLGHSNPLSCGLSQEQSAALEPYPQPGGFAADVATQKQIVEQCFEHSGARLPFITTANTARDLDQIRIALGESKISYFGTSYGTYLGAVYASLYPTRTDRVVLDSAVGPRMVWRYQFRSWGPAMEIRFPDFAAWAAARHSTYGFGTTPAAVRATYFRLAAQLDTHPQGEITGNVFGRPVEHPHSAEPARSRDDLCWRRPDAYDTGKTGPAGHCRPRRPHRLSPRPQRLRRKPRYRIPGQRQVPRH